MPDETIEVEWISTATKMLATLDKIDARYERQEKLVQKLADTGKKGGDAVAGSFNKLEQELKDAEAAMKKMEMGTKAFADQKAKVDGLRASVNNAKGALASTSSGVAEGLTQAAGKIGMMVAGVFSMEKAVQAVLFELEKAKQIRMDAAATAMTYEQALASMAMNVGAGNTLTAKEMIDSNARDLKVDRAGLANLMASAISGGAKDLNEALQLSASTLKVTGGDAAKAAPIMSGMLSLAATTGNRNFNAALGQLAQFQEAARGEDLATSINNMSTAMAAANTRGDRIGPLGGERTLELASVMSQILQDPRMAVTGTAMRQMVMKLDAFSAGTKMKLDDGTVSKLSKEQANAFNKLGTFDERLAAMRANPELGRQFLSTIENSEGKVAIRQLVQGGEAVQELEKQAAKIVTPLKEAEQAYKDIVDVVKLVTPTVQASAAGEANLQGLQLSDQRAQVGAVQQQFERLIDNMDLPGIDMLNAAGLKAAANAQIGISKTPIEDLAVMAENLTRPTTPSGMPNELQVTGANAQSLLNFAAEARETNRLLQRMLELQEKNQKPQQAQQVRPKEAPLPAATAP